MSFVKKDFKSIPDNQKLKEVKFEDLKENDDKQSVDEVKASEIQVPGSERPSEMPSLRTYPYIMFLEDDILRSDTVMVRI